MHPGHVRLDCPRLALAAALLVPLTTLVTACASGPPTPDPSATPTPYGSAAPDGRVTLSLADGTSGAPFDVPRRVAVPAGWTAEVWARADGARMALWTPGGDLLVSRPGRGDVVALHPAADPAAAPTSRTVISGLRQPHGLALAGSTLYVAESNQVDRTTLNADGTVGPLSVLVGGLPDSKSPELGGQYAHALKSVAVGGDGTVYITVGSTGNISPQDLTASPPRAAILAVNPDGTGLRTFAAGVRNGEGLAFDPDGALWTAVNNRDNIAYPFHQDYDRDGSDDHGKVMQPYVEDHPAEELAKLSAGRNLGWPYCNPDPDVTPGQKGSALSYATMPYERDAQQNPDGATLDCSSLPRIERGLPAHSAALGLSFLTGTAVPAPWRDGAVVGVHGSWNRATPREPEVAWFPWDATAHTLGAQVTILGGFQDSGGGRFGRPVDAVAGPDGALYVTDDQAGAVYRLVPPGAAIGLRA